MNDDSIDDLIAEQLSAGDQSERLGGLTDRELDMLQRALGRMKMGRKMLAPNPPEEAVQFAPEERILAEELDESGEPTGNSRDYDMATGQERRTMGISPSEKRMRMRMDGAGAGPMPKRALPKKTMDYTLEDRSPLFEKELGLSYQDAAQMPVLPKERRDTPQKEKAEEPDDE